jgi:hypothetical protein
MTRDELATALRGILGHGGTLTEDRLLALVDAYAQSQREQAAAAERARCVDVYADYLSKLSREMDVVVRAEADRGRAEERARIRQLAVDRDARWQPTAICNRDCSRAPHPYPAGNPQPFADLLDGPPETEGT